MIYLLDIILITHIISYNKMLILYHMSSRETHLSNIHLNKTRISAYTPLTFCSARDYYFQHCGNNRSGVKNRDSLSTLFMFLKRFRKSVILK